MLVNIIDNRKHPYQWRQITAIAEPAWHDNRCKEADQVRERPIPDWSYDEYKNTSVGGAIHWASEKPGLTTLYLYDLGDGIKVHE